MIHQLEEVGSTMDFFKDSPEDFSVGCAILSKIQTRGRGQRQNSWNSETGGLYASVLLAKNPQNPASFDPMKVYQGLGYSISNTLSQHFQVKSWLKPPNDLYVDEKKLMGILVENIYLGNELELSILGIGMNVYNHDIEEESFPAVCLQSLVKDFNMDLPDLLKLLLSGWNPELN